ncbi:YhcN/YlaJ family sporulation lipoprotein [Alicyclobacillus sp.]|uniref:YhcN/YlaJ family sporulation lipoprotein n=1 Tax=Alicyclobacillus sp. TaxID=61169 RepID=UPI0025BA6710|nr:YhcN/YlaJ family sporulation lipoprotein [Alicyclobacillus sp.]MCL6515754.1 YhcN/YlaJ family sporulation lipoprotein [Alicyclobacillus sp.]
MRRWITTLGGAVVASALCAGCTAPWMAVNRGTGTAAEALHTPNLTARTRPADGRLQAEQRVADRVARIPGVRRAAVLVAGDTAYIGVELAGGTHAGLAEETKQSIIRTAKAAHPGLRRVLVSANPDVYHHLRDFASDLAAGRPVDAVWSNLRSMVERVWPDVR